MYMFYTCTYVVWSRKWQPTPVFLPGEFHGQWSLGGYSPWGAELNTIEHPHTYMKSPHTAVPSGTCVRSHVSRVQLFATPWTVVREAPLFTGCSRQVHWSGLPFPPPGDLLDPGIKPASLLSPALASKFLPLAPLGKPIDAGGSLVC